MAKKGIHPKYHEITMVLPDGKEIKTKSTFPADRIILEVDISTHPAWKTDGGSMVNEKSSSIAEFRKKYGSFDINALKNSDA